MPTIRKSPLIKKLLLSLLLGMSNILTNRVMNPQILKENNLIEQ